MTKLALYPTEMSQWQALMADAQARANIQLPTELESYLVFMLMRFMQETQLSDTMFGLDFLQCHHDVIHMPKVGDKCLIMAGLFPNFIQKRQLALGYVAQIGISAYQSASLHDKHDSQLYKAISEEFICLRDILYTCRQLQAPQDL